MKCPPKQVDTKSWTILLKHVRLVGRDGRRRYHPASRDRLVAACLEPSVSVFASSSGARRQRQSRSQMGKESQRRLCSTCGIYVRSGSDSDGYALVFCQRSTGEGGAGRQAISCIQAERGAAERNQPDAGMQRCRWCGGDHRSVEPCSDWALMKVYLHREPIDFRAGINSLAVLVQEVMELDPFAPSVFAFCNRRRDRVKLLFFDRSTSTETSNIKSICQTKITNLFSLRLYQQAPKY